MNERLDWVGGGRMEMPRDEARQLDVKNGIGTLIDQVMDGSVVSLQTQYEVRQTTNEHQVIVMEETGRYRLVLEWEKPQ
jgi:hypothetical protein